MRIRRLHADSDEGAVAVFAGLVLTVLLLVSALVIDLGALRADRVAGKAVADMSSTAAVVDYEPGAEDAALGACQDALDYAVRNLDGLTVTPVDGDDCTTIFTGYQCESDDPLLEPERTAVYQGGTYVIEITLPVHDDNPLMQGRDHEEFDGEFCQRVGVRIHRERTYLLSAFTGLDSGTTTPGSVALKSIGGKDEFVSLIVLERENCQTLLTDGASTLRVYDLETTEDGETVTYPGRITVDTQPAGCTGHKKVIDAGGGSGILEATGDIFSYALQTTDPGNAATYDPARVPDDLTPEPEAGPLISRQTIDHLYNCQTAGYTGATPSTPYDPDASHVASGPDDKVGPCPSGAEDYEARYGRPHPSGSYIADLHDALQGVDAAEADAAADWSVYPDDVAGADCDAGQIAGTAGTDKWFVDCAGFEPTEFKVTNVEFLVLPDGLALPNGSEVWVNEASGFDPGTVIYLQDGEIQRQGGDLRLRDAFIYLNSRSAGRVGFTGSSGRMSLMAPLDETQCAEPGGVPNASCFAPVVVWSNYIGTSVPNINSLQGDASGGITGTIFTPNAKFRFRGEGTDSEDPCRDDVGWDDIDGAGGNWNMEGSQFYAGMMDTAGGASVRLCPSPDTTVSEPVIGTRLIR